MIDLPALRRANRAIGAFVDWCDAPAGGEGPLAGVTVGVKSNIAVAGLPWTGGMGWRAKIIAQQDAQVVARLRSAGAVILGTLNMHEAALGGTTDNLVYGRTHNPWRAGFTAGGSSGGSAAAVAARLCDLALGTDTLGSIRIPAAYCGLYGLKPTYERVSMDGLIHLDRAFDCIGPIAADLDLMERAWAIMSDDPVADPRNFARLLLLDGLAGVRCDPAIVAALDEAAAAIGLPPTHLALPAAPDVIRLAALVQAASELASMLGPHRADVSPSLDRILTILSNKTADTALLTRLSDYLRATLADDGLLLMPTTPQTAFAHDTRPPANQADFTTLASVGGLPALAIPAGLSPGGLPLSLQLVGPAGSERRLIGMARVLEPVFGGALRPPPLLPKES